MNKRPDRGMTILARLYEKTGNLKMAVAQVGAVD